MLAGGVLVQRFGDLVKGVRTNEHRLSKSFTRPTLTAAVPGDLSLALPKRQLDDIIEMIYVLDKIAPGTANHDTLLYGAEVKFYSARLELVRRAGDRHPRLLCRRRRGGRHPRPGPGGRLRRPGRPGHAAAASPSRSEHPLTVRTAVFAAWRTRRYSFIFSSLFFPLRPCPHSAPGFFDMRIYRAMHTPGNCLSLLLFHRRAGFPQFPQGFPQGVILTLCCPYAARRFS